MIELFNDYIDEYGCLVCKDAMPPQYGQAGREDSAHKAAFYNFYLMHNFNSNLFFENFIPPHNYVNIQGLKRHKLSRYSTSRDQLLPFLIMLDRTDFVALKKVVIYQIENCYIEKDEYKKYQWLIRLFNHAPNGDLFLLPHHLSVLSRVKGKYYHLITDLFLPLVALSSLLRRNDKHLISNVLMFDYLDYRKPNIFTKLSSWLFNKINNRCVIAKEYFSGENNPPIWKVIC